jgi:DNA-directed RNA polymerase subunit B
MLKRKLSVVEEKEYLSEDEVEDEEKLFMYEDDSDISDSDNDNDEKKELFDDVNEILDEEIIYKVNSDFSPNNFKIVDEPIEALVDPDPDEWKNHLNSTIFTSLLSEHRVEHNHTIPFNVLIRKWIPDILEKYGKISTEFNGIIYNISLSNYKFVRSRLVPSECHMYNETYSGSIYADITEERFVGELCVYSKVTEKFHICDIPIMLLSDVCNLSRGINLNREMDNIFGGSFICNGKKRYIPITKTLQHNVPYRVRSETKNSYSIHIRSTHFDKPWRSTSTLDLLYFKNVTVRTKKFYSMLLKISFVNSLVPLQVIILCFGWTINEFIERTNSIYHYELSDPKYKKYFISLRSKIGNCVDSKSAIEHLNIIHKKPGTKTAINALRIQILPHLNEMDDVPYAKCDYLAYMFGMLMLFIEGEIGTVDRDSYKHCRLVNSSGNIASLFRMKFKRSFHRDGLKIMRKALSNHGKFSLDKVFNSNRLTRRLTSSISTGDWSPQKKGISSQYSTSNPMCDYDQLSRISTRKGDGKHIKPRMIQVDSFGYICSAVTPERNQCGLVYPLAITAVISVGCDSSIVMQIFLSTLGDNFYPYPYVEEHTFYTLFDSRGRICGYIPNIDKAVKLFVYLRRNLFIDPHVSFELCHDIFEMRIYCDSGRLLRPLLIIDNLAKTHYLLNQPVTPGHTLFRKLLNNACIEFVSPTEEKHLRPCFDFKKALDGNYTHLEITQISHVSTIPSIIPCFANDQGARISFFGNMAKQAIYSHVSQDKGAATTHNLLHGYAPLCGTQATFSMNIEDTPRSIPLKIVFFPDKDNQEDALLISKSVCDMGFFTSTKTRTYTAVIQTSETGSGERFENPLLLKRNIFGKKTGSYKHLLANGLPRIGSFLNGGDVVIGKTVQIKKMSTNANVHGSKRHKSTERSKVRRDKSIQLKSDESGTVIETWIVNKPYKRHAIAKVKIRTIRKLEVGDKLTSDHAQKGVIGRIVNEEDMMFSADGPPHIQMSPTSMTSRMTIGLILSMLIGKVVPLETDLNFIYDKHDLEESSFVMLDRLQKVLKKHGYSPDGTEVFYSGTTGEMIKGRVMTGFVSYSKLTHMVRDKTRARSEGQKKKETRQPTTGKKVGGGLRCGNMETNCLLSYGANSNIKGCLIKKSDPFDMFHCECGMPAQGNENLNKFMCQFCGTGQKIKKVTIPYTLKYIRQILSVTGISIRSYLENDSTA